MAFTAVIFMYRGRPNRARFASGILSTYVRMCSFDQLTFFHANIKKQPSKHIKRFLIKHPHFHTYIGRYSTLKNNRLAKEVKKSCLV